ncbi:MAG: hypothetical protein N4A59_12265 [Marinifilum sp.]|jgi:hypothetical protein|nr:hypothetical protein [Marinifilum sp.]
MNRKALYKILITILLVMVVPIYGMTQDRYVLIESVHNYKVTETVGNNYAWIVVTNPNLQTAAPASAYEIVGDADQPEVNFKWKEAGEYYVMVQETNPNGCSIWRAIHIEVVTTPTIEFKELTSSDCADENNEFATELVAMFDSGTQLPESQYPITLKYRITGDTDDRTATINFADKMLNVLGIIEDENIDKSYDIIIKSAVNKYGGTLNVVTGNDNHTRSLYALPQMTPISIK